MALGAAAGVGLALLLNRMPGSWTVPFVFAGVAALVPLFWLRRLEDRRHPRWPPVAARFPGRRRPTGDDDVYEFADARVGVQLTELRRRTDLRHEPHLERCFVGVHDAGLYLRPREGPGAAAAAFVPWEAVVDCKPGMLGRRKYGGFPVVWLTLADGEGKFAVEEDPAGTAAQVRLAAWRRRRRSPRRSPTPAG